MAAENRKQIGSTWMAIRTYKGGKALTFGQTTWAWWDTVAAGLVVVLFLVLAIWGSNQGSGWDYLESLVLLMAGTWAVLRGLKPTVIVGPERIVIINPVKLYRIDIKDIDSITRGKAADQYGWHWVVIFNTRAGGHVKVLRLCSTKASHLDPIVAGLRGAIESNATLKARHGLADSDGQSSVAEGPLPSS